MGIAYNRWLEAHKSPDYWGELAKLEFATTLNEKMEEEKISKSELAERISTSKAYISKVLGGDTNFTIETMTKMAFALGFRLDLNNWLKIENDNVRSPSLETSILETLQSDSKESSPYFSVRLPDGNSLQITGALTDQGQMAA